MTKNVKKFGSGGATSEFGKAFRSARSSGLKTFDWNGKKYTTDRADDAPYRDAAKLKLSEPAPAKAKEAPAKSEPAQTSMAKKVTDTLTKTPKPTAFTSEGSKMPKGDADSKWKAFGKKLTTKGSNARPYNPPADDTDSKRKGGSIKDKSSSKPKWTPPWAKKGITMKKMASGGSFRSSANGIAKKGKTKAKQVKMAGGGKMMASGGKMKGC
jgi:hypothetical protein